MHATIKTTFVILTCGLLVLSCKKNKTTAADSPASNTPATPSTTYSVTGRINSCYCSNVTSGLVFLNPTIGPGNTAPYATIQPNGSFTFTYSSISSYSAITLSYIAQGHQGYYKKDTKTVPANQNCDIGTYDFDTRCSFYVRFRSLSSFPTTSVSLIDETFVTHQSNNPYQTPVLEGPFTDTTLVFTHDVSGGNVIQHSFSGYDPYSESSVTELPISFKCTHNNITYSAQKNMLKCNGSPTDTLYINLP